MHRQSIPISCLDSASREFRHQSTACPRCYRPTPNRTAPPRIASLWRAVRWTKRSSEASSGNTSIRLQAETCIVDDILRWEFPQPLGAGSVVVDYPFVLVPADSSGDDASDAN
jgi:hypothetical protein